MISLFENENEMNPSQFLGQSYVQSLVSITGNAFFYEMHSSLALYWKICHYKKHSQILCLIYLFSQFRHTGN